MFLSGMQHGHAEPNFFSFLSARKKKTEILLTQRMKTFKEIGAIASEDVPGSMEGAPPELDRLFDALGHVDRGHVVGAHAAGRITEWQEPRRYSCFFRSKMFR